VTSERIPWWRRIFGSSSGRPTRPPRLDYLGEALALERQGNYDAALTSYRLAMRDFPNDPKILTNLAIACTKTGRHDEALRSYRRALELDAKLSGAHYGLAFLLLKRGDAMGAEEHLVAFLEHPPKGEDAAQWIGHAQQTLERLRSGTGVSDLREPE
jgi:Flp pilus assembly protein TadD